MPLATSVSARSARVLFIDKLQGCTTAFCEFAQPPLAERASTTRLFDRTRKQSLLWLRRPRRSPARHAARADRMNQCTAGWLRVNRRRFQINNARSAGGGRQPVRDWNGPPARCMLFIWQRWNVLSSRRLWPARSPTGRGACLNGGSARAPASWLASALGSLLLWAIQRCQISGVGTHV